MRTVVVYESMYGNTRRVAEAIAEGAGAQALPVNQVSQQALADADLVVVGGPTHAHGMSRATTRSSAAQAAGKPGTELSLEPGADGPGLREWLASLDQFGVEAAAFDTRVQAPAVFTGRASKGLRRQLRKHGATVIAEPESFFVTKDNHLVAGELVRARAWGQQLAEQVATHVR
jgi:menaquinone-dependent protoporphyrinogen IX oxidase